MSIAALILLVQIWTSGGEGGIRTHGRQKTTAVFKTARLSHFRTSPMYLAEEVGLEPTNPEGLHLSRVLAYQFAALLQLFLQ